MQVRHGHGMKIKDFMIQAAEVSYLRGACGLNRMDGESNENVYEKYGMNCGLIQAVKHSSLRWFGHLERIGVIN